MNFLYFEAQAAIDEHQLRDCRHVAIGGRKEWHLIERDRYQRDPFDNLELRLRNLRAKGLN
ncbi:MAG: hypothetical protein CME16_06160 [Gemmatimonadetes bacterium]|nr:hypothetical protein [Gemmatimonadota bacterium]